ncbi:hypothetical protein F442_23175 [Phytophthora nicotianae P10297]|uniref:Uncharacterized protein n=1 Tax=Phytophthora nicotianae P10297 TaxID=1317064 RepID=W2XYT5_PHYNI|nr:hypothetical protein F442_23175 [Phytophthora nicotianae P10297]
MVNTACSGIIYGLRRSVRKMILRSMVPMRIYTLTTGILLTLVLARLVLVIATQTIRLIMLLIWILR